MEEWNNGAQCREERNTLVKCREWTLNSGKDGTNKTIAGKNGKMGH
jgi:hypothetical protein